MHLQSSRVTVMRDRKLNTGRQANFELLPLAKKGGGNTIHLSDGIKCFPKTIFCKGFRKL